jgi:uncharacterized protein DUF6077
VISRFIDKFRETKLLVLPLLWILLWITPWASWLDSFPWIRVGISILIFSVPGMVISLLLLGKRITLSAHFISGLAISVLLVGSLGLFGRIVHLPFGFIRPVFALIGLITLFALIYYSRLEHQLYKPKRFSLLTLALLLCMLVLGIITNLQSRFGGDDFSYLAYLTNWQHAQPLSFRDILFESGDVDAIRFRLSVFPMNLAFLAEISKLHGLLLLGLYLEPYLVPIAIIAIYSVYEDFLEEKFLTIAAMLLHFTFLVLLQATRQPGSTFFARLSEDKVFAAFILAPIFFLGIRHFLELFTLRNGIFAFLCGLSLALTHPVILAYSAFIAGLYISIVTIMERNYKKFVIGITLLVITLLPSVSLRFIDGPQTTKYAVNLQSAIHAYGSQGETRFSYIEGTPFYGFDLERIKIQKKGPNQETLLEVLISWSYLWVLGLGFLWSLFNLKKRKIVAPFIAATSLLVLLCGIPYTGWLFGYLVSAGMLWRSPWLLPIGLIGVVLFADSAKFVLDKVSSITQFKNFCGPAILGLTFILCMASISYFSVYRYDKLLPAISRLGNYRNNLERLTKLGNYLESNFEQPSVFIAPLELMNYLPGLSSKAKVVYFRTSAYSPDRVNTEKVELIFTPDTSIPMKQRMNILRRYHVQYVVIADRSLQDYYANYTEFFKIQKINGFWILEFQDLDS